MQTNNHSIVDYDSVLDAKFGKVGAPERVKHEDKARAFYAAQVLLQARREANITQSELAQRVGTTKSYISKIENGLVEPSIGLFLRLINALGLRVEIVKPLGI